jgi:dsDNA-specific endonuclease/ATPase MutS2
VPDADDQAPLRVPIEREIDLHAFGARDIRSVVDEYVTAAAAAGLTEVRLIHGRGRGVQRAAVQATLERHSRVIEFWDDTDAHLGATVARLEPERTQEPREPREP